MSILVGEDVGSFNQLKPFIISLTVQRILQHRILMNDYLPTLQSSLRIKPKVYVASGFSPWNGRAGYVRVKVVATMTCM